MMLPKGFRIAGPFWTWALDMLGADGITMPWGRVYLRARCAADAVLIVHEQVHLEQIERDGAITFSVRYLWWWWRRGYWLNPYEIEAYTRDGRGYIYEGHAP